MSNAIQPAYRCGHVAIVGRPNAGKSTLLNTLLKQKISITSRRPQTTRQRITGILTLDHAQLIFLDTPGFQTQHRNALTRAMNRTVNASAQEADVVLWMIDALQTDTADQALHQQLPENTSLIIVLNKVDRISNKNEILNKIKYLNDSYHPATIVPISATNGHNVDGLIGAIVPLLPAQDAIYVEDEVTTLSVKALAAELIREKLFRLLGAELPYASAVEIESFKETPKLVRIQAVILVDKAGQKSIVIGKGGEKLKIIGTQARLDIEKMVGTKVFLELWVKVRGAWADDPQTLHRLGLE